MSIQGGPDIVNDGLILHIDAANIRSYVSGSSTIYDLSGNNNTGSLINGVAYTGSNKGCLLFDGSNDYVKLPPNFFNFDTGDPFSLSVWFKISGSSGLILGNTSTTGGAVPALFVGSSGKLYASCFWGGNIDNKSISPINVNDNLFHNITITFSSSIHRTYLDGAECDVLTKTQTPYSSRIYNYDLGGNAGTWDPGPQYLSGVISSFSFYNKALTANEVYANCNAVKGRYYANIKYTWEYNVGVDIPTNGLVLFWDVANSSSYSGSGNKIYDLCGKYNGTLINSPTYSTSNGGILTFNGSSSYLESDILRDLTKVPCTVIGASKYNGGVNGRMINAKGNNWLMGHWSNSVGNYFAEGWVTSAGFGGSDTKWRIYATTNNYQTDTWKFYINGSLVISNSNGSAGPNGIRVGALSANNEYSDGSFSFLMIYSRILSDAEITQIYNTFAGRFTGNI